MTEPNRRWAENASRSVINDDLKRRSRWAGVGEPEELGPLAVYLASDASAT